MSGDAETTSAEFVRTVVLTPASGMVVGLHLFVSYGTQFTNAVFSGIVVDVDGHQLWVSSGHCIDEIRSALTADNLFSWNAGLLDGYDDFPAIRLPLRLDLDRLIGGDTGNIDAGAIRLSKFTMTGLEHNASFRLAPIDSTPQSLDEDPLYLLGYQASSNSPDLTNTESTADPEGVQVNRMTFRLVPALSAIPVRLASEEHSRDAFEIPRNAPAFDLLLGADVFPDIAGMSGGPIVRLSNRDESGAKLSVVAVQSEWNWKSRVIRADRIDTALNSLRSELWNSGVEPLE